MMTKRRYIVLTVVAVSSSIAVHQMIYTLLPATLQFKCSSSGASQVDQHMLGATGGQNNEEVTPTIPSSGQQEQLDEGPITNKTPAVLASTTQPLLFDPFKLWSRRDEVSLVTINGVLYRADHDPVCQNHTFYFPSTQKDDNGGSMTVSSLEQVAAAIHRKLRQQGTTNRKKIVVAFLGDSVAADPNGFVGAIESFFVTSPWLYFGVEVRNFAKGGTGPRFTYYCNDLRGDEDIVIYETARPGEQQAIVDLVASLQKSGFGVILASWRGERTWNWAPQDIGFTQAADTLNVPLIKLNDDPATIQSCLPPDVNTSDAKLVYRDEIHPNRLGEITLATMIGRTIERAVRKYVPEDLSINTPALLALATKSLSNFDTHCYIRLDCKEGDPEAIGTNKCLKVAKVDGFRLGQANDKVWWEGVQPGDAITLQLDEPCTEIILLHSLSVINGMAKIWIDGEILDAAHQDLSRGELPQGVLDGWFKGFTWLPRNRGFLREVVIAHDIEPKSSHTVRLEVLNTTHSEDGIYKFDFAGFACRKGPMPLQSPAPQPATGGGDGVA